MIARHETLILIIAMLSGLIYILTAHQIAFRDMHHRFLQDWSGFEWWLYGAFWGTRVTLSISILLLCIDLWSRA